MALKIIGTVLIMSASVIWGAFMASKKYFRLKDLREMKRAYTVLRSEIDYGASALEDAAKNVAAKVDRPVRELFENFATEIGTKSEVWQIWGNAVENIKAGSGFLPEDLEMFKSFGKTLGYLDKDMQLNNIDMQIDYINMKTAELEGSWEKERKMYLSLGTLGGALAAVLLL